MLLSELQQVIGLSETKIKNYNDSASNIDIEGYDFVSKPALTNAGCIRFYTQQSMQLHIRDDLCSTTNENMSHFASRSIVLHTENLVCAILFRHPSGRPEDFTRYRFFKYR